VFVVRCGQHFFAPITWRELWGPGRNNLSQQNLEEAPVSENAPFQSQRQAKKFARKRGKKRFKPTLLHTDSATRYMHPILLLTP
jgi:hypothetical protein